MRLPRAADVAGAVGSALGLVSDVVARVRPDGRTLHPRGAVVAGVLVRSGRGPRTGAAWLDDAGVDRVLVRVSRSLGLPRPLPDVAGLAVRVPLPGGRHADLLFSSAGTGVVTRHLLRPSRRQGPVLTTLLPVRSPTGHVLLSMIPRADGTQYVLRACRPGRSWWDVGELLLDQDPARCADRAVRFDATQNPLPDLPFDDWVVRLREPAYAAARRVGAHRS